ncbi:CGGC domain-containing protein [Geosporobacter ferrireducens]|uniref:CGGC domain-containing protein n=1 Tax=Geosporobacter ferrireducens TaxID=1424294 RepID=A0A1D8GCR5_9FIRM|nr:CGGC domain-containing protein [Geosporobacter ferrireducens]AOT68682.1 CGGC domain-containing protein [Geosporobacter ferrireducens]MTI57566.1 CGGC domain-containing protein [Geosporobacter ferrireducens]
MEAKYVVILQCEIAHNRCSGFACTNAFYNKEGVFDRYTENTRYISFTCGGCCGKSVSAKLEHLSNKFRKKTDVNKDDVVIHLASCMTTDNYHYDRCPHIEYIKGIVEKRGFKQVVEGSYVSKNASRKREQGIYKDYLKIEE